jgi:putative DNA methylase
MYRLATRKKLIEVALPLAAINAASSREKSIRHGHPSTLHLWWARRPLAAARAVLFAQLVDDPSSWPELFVGAQAQEAERQRLFAIIEQLVLWENTSNEELLRAAREEIHASWRRSCAENEGHPQAAALFDSARLPAFHDPFAGGGALPLEAQRLGLEAYASDLNPVAVLINKAMIEIPPKFAGRPPVHPETQQGQMGTQTWQGAQGLAEDLRRYGQWMRDEAEKRIGAFYPPVAITAAMAQERPELQPYVGRELTVIAWLWARTVNSPNPAYAQVAVPLASTFMLSTKAGKEAYVEPVMEKGGYRFTVKTGKPDDPAAAKMGTKLGRGANFKCLMSAQPIEGDYIKAEGRAGRMGARLMAIVAQGDRERVYLAPSPEHEAMAHQAKAGWRPAGDVPARLTGGTCVPYGLTTWADLFTERQLLALSTFGDLVQEARELIEKDAIAAGLKEDPKSLRDGGQGAKAYAEAVSVYLAFAVDYATNYWSVIATPAEGFIRGTFSRQALPMTWDFAEAPPFGNSSGNWIGGIEWAAKAIEAFPYTGSGWAAQSDAQTQTLSIARVVSTDPPYYDNIGYADLSDFFYVWLRRSLRPVFPELFGTVAVPKAAELVATPYRHGGKEEAESFFLEGMTLAMTRLAEQAHPAFPVSIYYAFKQAETKDHEGTASTGWETFLEAVIQAGFAITGTWPMRTEREARSIGIGTNALASSVILVCRRRGADAPLATRRDFMAALQSELPPALAHLQSGNIAPVDLAQAAIGPGMAVYTRYRRVLDAEGRALSVREALALINQSLDEVLAEQEGDYDADSRWALTWFDQQGFAEGEYGLAEQLSKSKNTSVAGMVEAGILNSKAGQVRLLRPEELRPWQPAQSTRLGAWMALHQLLRSLEHDGESGAAALLCQMGNQAAAARELCYRLYSLCERRKRSAEALSYNALVQSWPEIARLAQALASQDAPGQWQPSLDM